MMMKCSPEAYAKCPDSRACGDISDAAFAVGSECDRFNQEVQHASENNSVPFDFLSAYVRMTKPDDQGECQISCRECPISWCNNGAVPNLTCSMFIRRYPERAVELLRKEVSNMPTNSRPPTAPTGKCSITGGNAKIDHWRVNARTERGTNHVHDI